MSARMFIKVRYSWCAPMYEKGRLHSKRHFKPSCNCLLAGVEVTKLLVRGEGFSPFVSCIKWTKSSPLPSFQRNASHPWSMNCLIYVISVKWSSCELVKLTSEQIWSLQFYPQITINSYPPPKKKSIFIKTIGVVSKNRPSLLTDDLWLNLN